MTNSGPCNISDINSPGASFTHDISSVMSLSSITSAATQRLPPQQLGTKVEMVYSLLSMLGAHNKEEMSRKLLLMSSSKETCIAMRQTGCLPLLVQLLHGNENDSSSSEEETNLINQTVQKTRKQASLALHNIVHSHPDDKRGRREARVLRLLEQLREYCDNLRDSEISTASQSTYETTNQHPGPAIAALMKLSFDEEHRYAMCQLGGLHAIAELIQIDHKAHGNTSDSYCVTLRRYAGMALTNLTFGDGTNKALLCSKKAFIYALVAQIHSPCEDLRQVTASVLRNLSWRADSISKQTLREAGSVTTLMKAAIEAKKESTLKSILSALWNLSAHCSSNKAEICAIDGALAFLVSTLTYKSPSKTLAIVENGGGILRNISSHIAVREDYRIILRNHFCLQILLQHLKSPSLTVVSNACGTLWNLSARCAEDQRTLWELGAVGMLRNLIHSKHKMISMGSSAALKNLLSSKPSGVPLSLSASLESSQFRSGTHKMPSLHVRKMRALEAEIDQSLSETYDNLDSPKASPTYHTPLDGKFFCDTNIKNSDRSQHFIPLPEEMYCNVPVNFVPHSDIHDNSQSEPIQRPDSTNDVSSFKKEKCYPMLKAKNTSMHCLEKAHARTDNIRITYPLKRSGQIHCPKSETLHSSRARLEIPVSLVESEIQDLSGPSGHQYDEEHAFSEEPSRALESEHGNILSCRYIPKYTKLVQKPESVNIEEKNSYDQMNDYRCKYSDENSNLFLANGRANHDRSVTLHKRQELAKPYPVQDTCNTKTPICKSRKSINDSLDIELLHHSSQVKPIYEKDKDSINQKISCEGLPKMNLERSDQPTNFTVMYKENIQEMDECQEIPLHSPDVKGNKNKHKHTSVDDYSVNICSIQNTPLQFSPPSSQMDLINFDNIQSIGSKSSDTIGHKSVNFQSVDQNENNSKNNDDLIEETTLVKELFICQNENEVMKTVENVNSSEETEVLFLRSSSLSSPHQNSLQNDKNTFVSNSSHKMSKVTSPNKFPDSSTKTISLTSLSTRKPVSNQPKKFPDPNLEVLTSSKPKFSFLCNATTIYQQNHEDKNEIIVGKGVKMSPDRIPVEVSRDTTLSFDSMTNDDRLLPSKQETTEVQNIEVNGLLCQSFDNDAINIFTTTQHAFTQHLKCQDSISAVEKKEIYDHIVSEMNIQGLSTTSEIPSNNNSLNIENIKLQKQVNNLSSSLIQPKMSNIPIKLNNTKLDHHVTSTAESGEKPSDLFSVSPKFVKDTSSNLSQVPSVSEISVPTSNKEKSSNSSSILNDNNQSDDSAFCDDNDNILFQHIKSGVSKEQSSLSSEAVNGACGKSCSTHSELKLSSISDKNLIATHATLTKPGTLSLETNESKDSLYVCSEQVTPKPDYFCLNNTRHTSRVHEKNLDPHLLHIHESHPSKLSESSETYFESCLKSPQDYAVEGTSATFQRNSHISLSAENYKGATKKMESMTHLASKQVIPDDLIQNPAIVNNVVESQSLSISKEKEGIMAGIKQNGYLSSEEDYGTQRLCLETAKSYNVEGTPVGSSGSSLSADSSEQVSHSGQALLHACENYRKLSKEYKNEKTELNVKEMQNSMDLVKILTVDEKGKEDEYVQEKQIISKQVCKMVDNPEYVETLKIEDSTDFQFEAQKVIEKVESELQVDLTESSISCMSDLENAKPPSIFVDIGSLSMTSSEYSDVAVKCSINAEKAKTKHRSKKRSERHEITEQSFFGSSDNDDETSDAMLTDSVDNFSMKASTVSEVLENINPPSFMNDLSLTVSCSSLNSINSDVLENPAQSKTQSMECTKESDICNRLNAAASVVQVYSQELSSIMRGSNGCNSELIDHVKPPTVYQDITEVTAEDNTELDLDTFTSDTEFDNDDLRDDNDTPVPSTETLKAPQLYSLQNDEQGSVENLTYVLDECESMSVDEATLVNEESDENLNSDICMSKVEAEALKVNANLVVFTLNEMKDDGVTCDESEFQDNLLEDETLSLVSNDSDDEHMRELEVSKEEPMKQESLKKPSVIRPLNKETTRQIRENKERKLEQTMSKITKSLLPTMSKRTTYGSNDKKNANHSQIQRPTGIPMSFEEPTRSSALKSPQKTGCQKNTCPQEKITFKQTVPKPEQLSCYFSKISEDGKVDVGKDMKNTSSRCQERLSFKNEVKTKEKDAKILPQKPLVKQGTFTKEEELIGDSSLLSPAKEQKFPSKSVVSESTIRSNCKSENFKKNNKTKDVGVRSLRYAPSGLNPNQQSKSNSFRKKGSITHNENRQSVNKPADSNNYSRSSSTDSNRNSQSSNGSHSSSSSIGTLSFHTGIPDKRQERTSKIASLRKSNKTSVKQAERKSSFESSNNNRASSRQIYKKSPSHSNRAQSSISMIPKAPGFNRGSTYKKYPSKDQLDFHNSQQPTFGFRKNRNVELNASKNTDRLRIKELNLQASDVNFSSHTGKETTVGGGTRASDFTRRSLHSNSRQYVSKISHCKGREEHGERGEEKSLRDHIYNPHAFPHHAQNQGISHLPTHVGSKISSVHHQPLGFPTHSKTVAARASAVVAPFNYVPSLACTTQQKSENEKSQQDNISAKHMSSKKDPVFSTEKERNLKDKCHLVTAL
ncbi:uncharacterized protein LOC143236692 isoform X2 [Tachypleus tridentatus]